MNVTILADACRCCMSNKVHTNDLFEKFHNIGPKIDPEITYADAVYLCTSIQFEEHGAGGLPKKICDECVYDLRVAINFRAKCEESEAMLRDHINNEGDSEIIIVKESDMGAIVLEEVVCHTEVPDITGLNLDSIEQSEEADSKCLEYIDESKIHLNVSKRTFF